MSVQILIGDARERLRELPDESVHCVVSSPPYWGLRDYGTAQWEGGDPSCSHRQGRPGAGRADGIVDERFQRNRDGAGAMGGDCRCGATRIDRQLGLEADYQTYVANMLEVFREVRRVLRSDGTLWLNLGDSYAGFRGNTAEKPGHDKKAVHSTLNYRGNRPSDGIKPKDLCGIPWRVAFALQEDGWWLRQDIIWSKPNPMPESVQDRCTKAHEYPFLLTKAERYYFDAAAIAESSITEDPRRPYTSEGAWQLDSRPAEQRHGGEPRSFKGSQFNTGKTAEHQLGRSSIKPRTIKGDTGAGGHGSYHREGREKGKTHARTAGNKSHKYVTAYEGSDTEEHRTKAGLMAVADVPWEKRNKRSVWTVATAPFAEAHFATFPPALIEPCILAGCPKGGAVLDPFGGAGTTGLVADRLGRDAILIELNPDYAAMAKRRIENDAGLFAEVAAD